jgi:glycosyltransferase involved in cell wall biosynthesis
MSHKVSVILPLYNAASTLEAAVASIFQQTHADWELLLLDDGSTDRSSEVARSFSQQDLRIRYISLPHQGIVSTLNHGLDLAQGNFIARMDADDICFPDRLGKQLGFLNQHPEVDVVSCQVDFGGNRITQAGYAAHVEWINGIITPDDHFACRFVDAPIAHPSVMWRKTVSDKYGIYHEGKFPEDFELWLRWMEQGARFAKVPEVLMTWNDPPERLSRQDDRYAPEAFYEVKCQYLNRILPKDRPIWLWGAGRVSRKRFATLKILAGYIDVDPKKIGKTFDGLPVVSHQDIPPQAYILSAVANRDARIEIKKYLKSTGRQPVQDFYLCA